ncbi:MAG: putative metal-binding motif-containing protein, partial [Myxococcales bacterium]|nr:putative metal-binding motif-containing protein [Myxococcales bacterium]
MSPFRTVLIWPALLALAALVACDDDAAGTGGNNPGDALPTQDMRPGEDLDRGPRLDNGPVDMAPDAAQFGEYGDPCERGSDCRSGYCIPGPDGARVCSALCRDDEDCGEGFECSPVINTAPDTVFICIAQRNTQCQPCDHDGDCGAGIDRCIAIGAANYCARSCATAECPEGNACEEREIDGQTVPLCVPEGGSCRPCMDNDGDGYGQGEECLGIDCDDSDPEIFEGAAERCDGRDNDCDSETDEGELVAPDEVLCLAQGVCAGVVPACQAGGWTCPYPDTYEAGAETRCDGLDNDCDGAADDDIDFQGDARNCGACGTVCAYENAMGVCAEAVCALGACARGWYDVDQDPANGCEYPCVPTADPAEICDGRDNDCNGAVDEGFDLNADPSHCGQCNRVCQIDRATPACDGGQCVIEACEAGWWNNDRDPANGCEYNCLVTFDGEERCDTLDNDCDGR